MSKRNGKNATGATAVPAVSEKTPLREGPGEGPEVGATAVPAVRKNTFGTTHPVTLRPAALTDREPLQFFFDTALRKDYFMRRGQLEDMLRGPHHQVFVAEIDTVLVGVAITTRGTRLVNALIHPAYRGLGIGQALIGYTGATEVRVKLDMSTGDPRSFYAALGFKPAQRNNGKTNIEVMHCPPKPDVKTAKQRTTA